MQIKMNQMIAYQAHSGHSFSMLDLFLIQKVDAYH